MIAVKAWLYNQKVTLVQNVIRKTIMDLITVEVLIK